MASRRPDIDVIIDRLNNANFGAAWGVTRITVHTNSGESWEFKRVAGVWSVDVDAPIPVGP